MAIENLSTPAFEAREAPHVKSVLGKVHVEIIDIREDREEYSILEGIKQGLRPQDGSLKSLPTLLLYDAEGLRLFEKITYLQEYYLTNTEIEVLEKYATSIADRIKPGTIIVELGSGNLRKIEILLNALEKAKKNVEYFALDLSLIELQRTLEAVDTDKYQYVKCRGLHGTYDDGLVWLKAEELANKPKAVMSMGSSIGNFRKNEASGFLRSFASILQPGDCMIIGIDACKDPKKVFHAYNDLEGTTHEFILNGLEHANRLLRSKDFNVNDWRVIGEYRYGERGGRHVAFVSPICDVVIDGVTIRKDEHVQIEESNKFSSEEAGDLFREAGLVQGIRWGNVQGDYALHMAYKPSFLFPSDPNEYAKDPVPSISDWDSLWTVWDIVTKHMIPKEELLGKPINLRNACIFYLGHIPTFLDIHLSRATGHRPQELEYYQKIFERGIDPDVDNPELCHDHSEIPSEYPPVEQILQYQDEVRTRVKILLESNQIKTDGALRKAMWLGFEHEAMHLETLLYMLVQSEKMLPPVGVVVPDFKALAVEVESQKVPNAWVQIPEREVSIGMHDPDKDLDESRFFGWDNEKPPRIVKVKTFEAKERPITNREYAEYLVFSKSAKLPASWISTNSVINSHSNGTNIGSNGPNGHLEDGPTNGTTNGKVSTASFAVSKAVRTVFGQVPLQYALDWPVMASYDEIAGCARWMGGRIPTMEEVRSIYDHVEEQKSKEIENRSENIPAVNSHLVNDGVEETPPQNGRQESLSSNGETSKLKSNNLFINLQNANVGFKSWHPTALAEGQNLAGQGEFGGVWEWTSSVLEKHDGFEPMELYPGYTADFFDIKHNIVLGGSWATHPRIAGRRSFVNWYQRNYPYVWAGARLVRDMKA